MIAQSSRRLKQPAFTLAAPQSDDDANAAIYRIGELNRQIDLLDIGFKDAVAQVKATFEDQTKPLGAERDALMNGVQAFAEANRKRITRGGEVKFATFPAGKLLWRLRPARCALPKDETKLAVMIAWIKANGFMQFIRTKEEISREAMLAEPELALKVPGIRIGSEGEDFVIEPFTAEHLEAAQ